MINNYIYIYIYTLSLSLLYYIIICTYPMYMSKMPRAAVAAK